MQSWFGNYERVKRCHLSGAVSAVTVSSPANTAFWCMHKRSISISLKCNSFQPSSRRGLTAQKTHNDFFLKLSKQQQPQKKSRKASSLICCPFPALLLVYFVVEILLECKVNRLGYSQGLGLVRRCQISRWASTALTWWWLLFRKGAPLGALKSLVGSCSWIKPWLVISASVHAHAVHVRAEEALQHPIAA